MDVAKRMAQQIEAMTEQHKSGTLDIVQSTCLVGGGGVGETMDVRLSGTCFAGQGLCVAATTLTKSHLS